jgi:hypothetical protein
MFTCNNKLYCYEHVHNTTKPTIQKKEYTKDELQELKESQQRIKINNLKTLYERCNQIVSSLEGEQYKDTINILLSLNNNAFKQLNTI